MYAETSQQAVCAPAEIAAGAAATRSFAKQPGHQILHGDCIPIMRTMQAGSIDLIVTDPPYLVRYQSRDGRRVPNDDNNRWLYPAFAEMFRVLKNHSFCISFYGWNKVDRFMEVWRRVGFVPVGHFVFSKPYSSSQLFTRFCHENAYLLAKGKPAKPAQPNGTKIRQKSGGGLMVFLAKVADAKRNFSAWAANWFILISGVSVGNRT